MASSSPPDVQRCDAVVVGSGVSGGVAALRLAEAGARVVVLEKGRRFEPEAFARSNLHLSRWLKLPALGWSGPLRVDLFGRMLALSGEGVGGGSLVYAGVLERPSDASGFYQALPPRDDPWAWKTALAPHFARAETMLGAASNPHWNQADQALGEAGAPQRGEVAPARLGTFFGVSGREGQLVEDPYFAGRGPARRSCTACGDCLLGCRVGAKNSVDKNYLYLAQQLGASIRPQTEVTWIAPLLGGEGFEVTTRRRHGPLPWQHETRPLWARHVLLCAGVMGTTPLMLRLRDSARGLPRLSAAVGHQIRSNGEALVGLTRASSGAAAAEQPVGPAIGAVLRLPGGQTVEAIRFGPPSTLFRLLSWPFSRATSTAERLRDILAGNLRLWPTLWGGADFARRSLTLLGMRSDPAQLRLSVGPAWLPARWRRLSLRALPHGEAPRAAMPELDAVARSMAAQGYHRSLAPHELLASIPTTAHLLGGCPMGDDPATSVVNAEHRVHGYPDLLVLDSSTLPHSPGINPALCVAALAEHAMEALRASTDLTGNDRGRPDPAADPSSGPMP